MSDVKIEALWGVMAKAAPSSAQPRDYPYQLMPPGTVVQARFFNPNPDGLPYGELDRLKLPFVGIVNSDHDSDEPVGVMVPCLSTWGKDDPVLRDQKSNWNGTKAQQDEARRYWKIKSFYLQCHVRSTPIVEQQDNPAIIRPIKFGKQLMNGPFKTGLLSGGMEWSPFGDVHGVCFSIRKTLQGGFNNYGTSTWDRAETPQTEEERQAVQQGGLLDFADLIGAEPDHDKVEMIFEMYQASRRNEPFDNAKWGADFRAFTMSATA